MPRPDETTGTEYITIDDFSAGIHSEFHGALSPRFTAADNAYGALLGKALARVDQTWDCHADKTGALIPLPKPQPTGIRDTIYPTIIQSTRPYRYVLDAQVGPLLADATEVDVTPYSQLRRQTIQTMWGYYADLGSSQYKPVVIGREYKPWVTFPPTVGQTLTAIQDFLVGAVVGTSDGVIESLLPIGSLTHSRFYYGNYRWAFSGTPFSCLAVDDTFTAQQDFLNDEPVIVSGLAGGTPLVNGTTYYVRDTHVSGVRTFRLAATRGGAAINITADGTGVITRFPDEEFRPLWMYPVAVCMAATPWPRWGGGNRWNNANVSPGEQSFYGFANGVGVENVPLNHWTPAIGLAGQGTTILGMQLTDDATLFMPFPAFTPFWFFHYSELGNVPQNTVIRDIANGPINPYILIAHQGRIVLPDRRRTPNAFPRNDSAGYGYSDDILFYSDVFLPMQDTNDVAFNPDKGVANATYGSWGGIPIWRITTQRPYNKLLVAEDIIADIGAIGVSTIDQMFIAKHRGGGALVQGDMDNPTIHRLPYVESTGGVTCKGALTPIGFVYGSHNGIFVWNGGDATERLSPQLDGFFWDHTDGTVNEEYAGSRGRMAFWNEFVFVPNNYLFDINTQSWWRTKVQTLEPVAAVGAPYNCYDVDQEDTLYAFPYRHTANQHESHVLFPAAATNLNCLSVPDPFGAGTQRDIRFCIDNVTPTSGTRTICGQWETTTNQRSFVVQIDTTDHLMFATSTDGAAGTVITAVCDDVISGDPILGRITWDSARPAGQQVVFYWKAAAGPIRQAMEDHGGWQQMGAAKAAAAAALFNSTDEFVMGNKGNVALVEPFAFQRMFAVSVATTIEGAPVYAHYPDDIPSNEAAATFPADTGQTVTVTRAGSGPQLALDFINTVTPPVWYTFEDEVLASSYSWLSHPLVQTTERYQSVQNVQLIATSASVSGSTPSVTVILRGYDQDGAFTQSEVIVFNLALQDDPQFLSEDVTPNWTAAYISVEINANDPNGNAAPKVQSLKIGVKPRQKIPRNAS